MPNVKALLKKLGMNSAQPLPPSCSVPEIPQLDPYDPVLAEVYRHRKQVGVNLGSLFVLERWLCPPSLCSYAQGKKWESELDFLEACESPALARAALEEHWQSYITEPDLRFLASVGINTVRIPISYWMVGRQFMTGRLEKFEGVYDAAFARLLCLIHAAASHKLGVLIDLHAAPGGQNTDSHCGVSTGRASLFSNASHRAMALDVLETLAGILAPITNVVGIEVLNEPVDHPLLSDFYLAAHSTIRRATPTILLPIYFSDAWNMEKYSIFLARNPSLLDFSVLDTHHYFCHMPADHAKTARQHTGYVQGALKSSLDARGARVRHNVIVGEWSVVLNGASIGQEDAGKAMQAFGDAQLHVWTATCAGQFYWNYRTADDGWYWSFQYCHKNGILPQHFTAGQVPADTVSKACTIARTERDANLQKALNEHQQYWNHDENIVRESWRYEQGYIAGFEVAVRFLDICSSRIGFLHQLAHEYAVEHGRRHAPSSADATATATADNVIWPFEHGFLYGARSIDGVLHNLGVQDT